MIDQRLAELGIILPEPPKAVGSYVPAVLAGDMLYISGQIPMSNGALIAKGPVGVNCTPDEAKAAAKQCVLNLLAIAKRELGSLDRIERVVQLQGFVFAPAGDFANCVSTINAASDLLAEILGDKGRHSRAAVCVAALPLGAAVEIVSVIKVGA